MGGLTPPKKPSASQMRQKALKCTVELEIQAVSTSTRVSFSTKTKYITIFVCYYDISFRVSILLATVAITEDGVSPSVKVATIRRMLINTPAFISASEVFIKSSAQAKLLDFFSQAVSIQLFLVQTELLLLFLFFIQRIMNLREVLLQEFQIFFNIYCNQNDHTTDIHHTKTLVTRNRKWLFYVWR